MRLSVLLAAMIVVPASCLAQQVVHMKFYLKGKEVGQNTWQIEADGAFRSDTMISFDKSSMTSSMTGHIRDGKIVDSICQGKQSDGQLVIKFDKGTISLQQPNSDWIVALTDVTGPFGAVRHPQLYGPAMAQAVKEIQAASTLGSTMMPIFSLDNPPTPGTFKVELGKPVTVLIAGKPATARHLIIAAPEGSRLSALHILVSDNSQIVLLGDEKNESRFAQEGWDKAELTADR